MTYSIVGVVGHIDHGKTSLVAALTGIDTDTHPEEKRRGITIDLGFAHLRDESHQFAFIDAPGHQKYIGNLLAGVSHIDIGLLVVACDQGIQEQTLEHVAILQMLGVRRLIVVLSRADLADVETQEALAEELELFLSEYGFDGFPIIPVSIVTQNGLDEVRRTLRALASDEQSSNDDAVRMPIDRVFTVPGRGCVVAGVVWTGSVRLGDELEVMRTGHRGRVRGLESHDVELESVRTGRRAALNLSGISANDIVRGDELLTPNAFHRGSKLLVAVNLFPDVEALKCPATAQLHTAATHCEARIVGVRQVLPNQECFAVLETSTPLVATYGQLGLLRRPYPVGSFAGVRILATIDEFERHQKQILQQANRLSSADARVRIQGWVDAVGEWSPTDVGVRQLLGLTRKAFDQHVELLVEQASLVKVDDLLVSHAAIERATRYLQKLLTLAAATEDAWIVEAALCERAKSTGSLPVVRLALSGLIQEKRAIRLNQRIALASDTTRLSKRQRACMTKLLAALADERMPPTLKELSASFNETPDMLASLARFATQQGLLVDLGHGMLIAANVFHELCVELRASLETQPAMTASEIKDLWGISRKYAIPLLEYCDAHELTRRVDDTRVAGPLLEGMI